MRPAFHRAVFPMLAVLAALCCGLSVGQTAHARPVIRVYGPGGPAPAMKEAAALFEARTGTKVEVTAGPTDAWIGRAKVAS